MTYIPDPVEIMDSQIDRMVDEFKEGHCMDCGKEVDYDLIQASASPTAPAVCYECLSPESQKAYDDFETAIEIINNRKD